MSVIRPNGIGQGDIYNLLQALVNRVFGAPALAVGSTAAKVKTTNDVHYCIGGITYKKAAEDEIVPSGLTNTGATSYRKVRVEVDSAGTVSFKEGPAATAQALALMPRRSASKATLGYIEIPNSFTHGSSAFTSVTFVDGDPDLGTGSVPPGDRGIDTTVVTS